MKLFRFRLRRSTGPIEAFQVVCAELWLRFRIPRAAYGVLLTPAHGEGSPSVPSLIGTYPAGLLQIYAAERHDLHDPTLWDDRRFTHKPRRWIQACNEAIRSASPQVRRVVEVAESFGNQFGYSIPVEDGSRTRRRAAFGVPKCEDMKVDTFDDQITNELRARELQDVFRAFHEIVPELNGFREKFFLTEKEAREHQYYGEAADSRSSDIIALHSWGNHIDSDTIEIVSNPSLADLSQQYDEEISHVIPYLQSVTVARGLRHWTAISDKGWVEPEPYCLVEEEDDERSSLGVVLPGASQFENWHGTAASSGEAPQQNTGATNVLPGSNIILNFDETVRAGSAAIIVTNQATGSSHTINPNGDFSSETQIAPMLGAASIELATTAQATFEAALNELRRIFGISYLFYGVHISVLGVSHNDSWAFYGNYPDEIQNVYRKRGILHDPTIKRFLLTGAMTPVVWASPDDSDYFLSISREEAEFERIAFGCGLINGATIPLCLNKATNGAVAAAGICYKPGDINARSEWLSIWNSNKDAIIAILDRFHEHIYHLGDHGVFSDLTIKIDRADVIARILLQRNPLPVHERILHAVVGYLDREEPHLREVQAERLIADIRRHIGSCVQENDLARSEAHATESPRQEMARILVPAVHTETELVIEPTVDKAGLDWSQEIRREQVREIPRWKDRLEEDRDLKPHEFIKRYYDDEIKAETLTQAIVRNRDPQLYMAYHNWRRRNPSEEIGFDFPTKKERYDRLLADGGISYPKEWLAKLADARSDADPETREAMRLYDTARRRARSRKA